MHMLLRRRPPRWPTVRCSFDPSALRIRREFRRCLSKSMQSLQNVVLVLISSLIYTFQPHANRTALQYSDAFEGLLVRPVALLLLISRPTVRSWSWPSFSRCVYVFDSLAERRYTPIHGHHQRTCRLSFLLACSLRTRRHLSAGCPRYSIGNGELCSCGPARGLCAFCATERPTLQFRRSAAWQPSDRASHIRAAFARPADRRCVGRYRCR